MRFSRQEYWTGLPLPSLIQPWCTSFPIWKKSVVPCPVLTVASWSAYRFLKRQVRWSGIPISLGISLLWFTQSESLHSQWSRRSRFFFFLVFPCLFYDREDVCSFFFWSFLPFSMIQRMLAIWSLVPLPFLNSAYTSGSFLFMYCWSLVWILRIISLAFEMSAIIW